jgi:hypothetical protein
VQLRRQLRPGQAARTPLGIDGIQERLWVEWGPRVHGTLFRAVRGVSTAAPLKGRPTYEGAPSVRLPIFDIINSE